MLADRAVIDPGNPPRVLVAEDEPGLRAFMARSLQVAGYEVSDVEDGQRALESLRADRFDLLVTDIVMPVMDGITLALIASSEWPDLRILMVTGYPAERQRALNLDVLIHGVIAKPFTLQELRQSVRTALETRAPGR
jgi:two-component system cell cycle response regulator CpdR